MMKKLFFLPYILALVIVSCGVAKKDVVLLNDQLVSKTNKCGNAEKLFFETCKTYNAANIQAELKNFTVVCKTVKGEVEAIEVHKDLEKLKASTLSLVNSYIKTEDAYKEYARLYSIATADYTIDDEKLASATAVKINNEIDMAFTEFQLTQKEFGNKYGYQISKK